MDITGDDYVIFTFGNPHRAIVEFVRIMQRAWPLLSIEHTEPDFQRRFEGERAAVECGEDVWAREHSSLYFYCKPGLSQFHEDNGYVLNPEGIGPFAIFIGKRKDVEFQLGKVKEIHSDRDLSFAMPPEPYEAWLAAPELIEVTLVAPSHDGPSDFTDHIWQTLLKCVRDRESDR